MQNNWRQLLSAGILCFATSVVVAQQQETIPAANLVNKSVKAIGYQVGGGSTKVDLTGTDLMPQAKGEAKVEAKTGATTIDAQVENMAQPSTLGTEFMTYVLWTASPDGTTNNLGEIVINKNGQGKLTATAPSQTFSLFITAEPYFAVRHPSEVMILENALRKDTKGKLFMVNDFKLMKRSQYQKVGNPLALTLDLKNVPLDVYQARNAVEIAKSRDAEKYAPEIMAKAQDSLKMTENALSGAQSKKVVISDARQTVQFAEDARALTAQHKEEERIANERSAAANAAKTEAEKKADEEAQRQAELANAKQAQMKAEADAASMKEQAAKADAERSRHAAEALRAQLLEQFNRILETHDTPRGLVVNMGDVLFDTGKFNLRPPAREALAKLSGIVLAHPGLNLAVEGYTDSTGSDELNQKLSEQRANAVRDYLVSQGLSPDSVTAAGFGKTMPVADNATASGRQQNRRVEIIISGEVIGHKIGQ
ncbi:MAG TPA: OmpA family protein [Candidatus Angelobacter sp.]|nr:OmpA family protein [Candidatus Angelobacter sp.]